MTTSPEIKGEASIVERPDEFSQPSEIPAGVENKSMPGTGVTPTPTQYRAQITDDKGNPMVQSPATQKITIEIPTTPENLEVIAKGNQDDSKTWWAAAFLRAIKKAMHFGWQVVTGGEQKNGTN